MHTCHDDDGDDDSDHDASCSISIEHSCPSDSIELTSYVRWVKNSYYVTLHDDDSDDDGDDDKVGITR